MLGHGLTLTLLSEMFLFRIRAGCELGLVSYSFKHMLQSFSSLPFYAYFNQSTGGAIIEHVIVCCRGHRCIALNKRVGERTHGVHLTEQSFLQFHDTAIKYWLRKCPWCSMQQILLSLVLPTGQTPQNQYLSVSFALQPCQSIVSIVIVKLPFFVSRNGELTFGLLCCSTARAGK